MKLRFIGKDGSMGLQHGKVYPVRIGSLPSDNCIKVEWPVSGRFWGTKICPYSSPAAFAANWKSVKEDGEDERRAKNGK